MKNWIGSIREGRPAIWSAFRCVGDWQSGRDIEAPKLHGGHGIGEFHKTFVEPFFTFAARSVILKKKIDRRRFPIEINFLKMKKPVGRNEVSL
ncbi:hypothetical protein D5272_05965 [bacterium D16-76]|nr:hypothetical protein [bacterium D16-76]